MVISGCFLFPIIFNSPFPIQIRFSESILISFSNLIWLRFLIWLKSHLPYSNHHFWSDSNFFINSTHSLQFDRTHSTLWFDSHCKKINLLFPIWIIFLIQFDSSFLIWFGSLFLIKFTQFFYLIRTSLHKFDSPFPIQLNYSNSVWLRISYFI